MKEKMIDKWKVSWTVFVIIAITFIFILGMKCGTEYAYHETNIGNYSSYESMYYNIYREAYFEGYEDGYTSAFIGIIVYNDSADDAVKIGIISDDNINLDYYRSIWNNYMEKKKC